MCAAVSLKEVTRLLMEATSCMAIGLWVGGKQIAQTHDWQLEQRHLCMPVCCSVTLEQEDKLLYSKHVICTKLNVT